ncbi:hypothetical protein H0W26_03400 [Candidatus Dependentiae bacterium]|nr:hypothetical protein [Candidatus Dependentiae bacterium]
MMKLAVTLVIVWNSLLLGTIQKQSLNYEQEEVVHNLTFIHTITIENLTKKEGYFVEGKEVTKAEFEEQFSHAEKEERKKKRQLQQEERFKFHETRYKGAIKINQKDLAVILSELEVELNRLLDERLKPFLIFPSALLSSEKELLELRDSHLPRAKQLQDVNWNVLDITTLNATLISMKKMIPTIKEAFLETVNNAIEKADDTRLLKELLTLI